MPAIRIAFLLFPDLLQLDCTGPYGILAAGPNVHIDLVWKTKEPVCSSDHLILTPTATIYDNVTWDILCIPGGTGILEIMEDAAILAFLQQQAATARYITSVCTGALILGAAGLLNGYRATTHWQALDMLAPLGATPVTQRVVIDGNRVTAAGVSAGLDMGLTLAGLLWGDETAQTIQLAMEYDPAPPYTAGTPHTAPSAIIKQLLEKNTDRRTTRLETVARVATKHRCTTS